LILNFFHKINILGEMICWGKESSKEKVIEGLENQTIVAISPSYDTCLFVSSENKIFTRFVK
jgi:hypothetical protein